ncbi:hypothetical protein K435DRAFT_773273, partial [Dendrothele bispora CBS 962.96]
MPKATCDACAHIVCYGPEGSGACLELVDEEVDKPSWASFLCPSCEFARHKETSTRSQFTYGGFYDGNGHTVTDVILSIRNQEFSFF